MSEAPLAPLRATPPPAALLRWFRNPFVMALLLFCLAILPFLPALHGQFLWDDHEWLANNPAVLAPNGLSIIWNPHAQTLHYYPLIFTTFWLEHGIWGLDTTGYHLINMIIHACGALILWRILDRLGLRAAWLAALLWAIHPVQVESVAWIVERKNTLSGAFYFLAAWSYLRFERIEKDGNPSDDSRPHWLFYALTILFFVAGLLSKTVICTLPAALGLILWWKRRKLSYRQIATLSLLLIIGLAIAIFTTRQEKWVMTEGGAENLSFTHLQRLVIAGRDVWFYLRTLAFPYPLMAIYPRWNYDVASFANYAAPIAVILVLSLLFFLRNRIGNAPWVGFAFFLITLSPGLGFINFYTMHFSFVTDHYQYLACIGIFALLAEYLFAFTQRMLSLRPDYAFLVIAVIFLALTPVTFLYATLFQSDMALWQWNVDHNPAAFNAQHNLGIAYMNAGDLTEAAKHVAIAVQQQPDDDFIQTTYGRILREQGDYQEAIKHFKLALALRPKMGNVHDELGKTYDRMHLPKEVLEEYAAAVAVDGKDPNQHALYAAALVRAKDFDKAIAEYKIALALSPGNLIVRYNFANLLLDLHRYPEAIAEYQTILQTQDDNPLIWHNLAAAYYESGQIESALAAKKKANDLDAKIAASTQSSQPLNAAPTLFPLHNTLNQRPPVTEIILSRKTMPAPLS